MYVIKEYKNAHCSVKFCHTLLHTQFIVPNQSTELYDIWYVSTRECTFYFVFGTKYTD